jgi:hypothetical protein
LRSSSEQIRSWLFSAPRASKPSCK